jgi:hypothetical protein
VKLTETGADGLVPVSTLGGRSSSSTTSACTPWSASAPASAGRWAVEVQPVEVKLVEAHAGDRRPAVRDAEVEGSGSPRMAATVLLIRSPHTQPLTSRRGFVFSAAL